MPPFVPSPPDSLRQLGKQQGKDEKESSDEPDRLHYTKVWLSALRMGYSRHELSVMPYGEIIFDLAAMNDARPSKQEEETDVTVRKATQEDIRSMLG
ncbi:MAG: hypothetical protein IKF78_00300 [Atopobiaceae bacterium]|nr:hypothetical protein [Atopobiaceae bacterium]